MSHIVLLGAGGTGMSGLAGIFHELGFTNLICIDSNQSELTDKLKKKGLPVVIGHGIYKVNIDDIIIYSEACAESTEVILHKKLNSEEKRAPFTMNYFQFLGEISKYFTTIGITGTNGKSSTTALSIFAAKDNSEFWLGILGALVPDFKQESYAINPTHTETIKSIFAQILTGKSHSNTPKKFLFIVEACEYKRHFLNLDLDYAIITNIEYDHADYYKDFDEYKTAYKQMLTKLKKKAIVLKGFLEEYPDFVLYKDKIEEVPEKKHQFTYIFGPHTDKNASLVDAIFSSPSLANFKGLRRRLEHIHTTKKGAQIFSDYGHMASSIQIGYEALKKKFPEKKLFCIFQPHQINRIYTGRNDFTKATKNYDQVIIYDIYPAREKIQDFNFSKFGANIHDIEQLGMTFAQQCWGQYVHDLRILIDTINALTNERIVITFTAGDLDFEIRNTYIQI